MRSTEQFAGLDRSLQRAWIKGAGFTDEELAQPLVLIANTYQDFSPENSHLRQVVDAVKAGVRMAGGTPLEFNTFHVTDSEAFAARSMRYVLPSRDVVADSIELMAEGHGVDGLVLLTGGDKPTPGMVMAAARLDLPSILLYAGADRARPAPRQEAVPRDRLRRRRRGRPRRDRRGHAASTGRTSCSPGPAPERR